MIPISIKIEKRHRELAGFQTVFFSVAFQKNSRMPAGMIDTLNWYPTDLSIVKEG